MARTMLEELRSRRKHWEHGRGGRALSVSCLCSGSSGLYPELFRLTHPFQAVGNTISTIPLTKNCLQLQGNNLPKVTAPPKGQPVASDWFIGANKSSAPLPQFESTLKGHPASEPLWWFAEALFITPLLCSFSLSWYYLAYFSRGIYCKTILQ